MATESGDEWIIFEAVLHSFSEIFWSCTLWTVALAGAAYFAAGILAARLAPRHFAFLVPLAVAIVGLLVGFTFGAVVSSFLASIYESGGFVMPGYVAAAAGLGQAALLVSFSLGRFPFLTGMTNTEAATGFYNILRAGVCGRPEEEVYDATRYDREDQDDHGPQFPLYEDDNDAEDSE